MKRKKKLILCQEAVGFLTQCTRPDFSFAVSAVSRYWAIRENLIGLQWGKVSVISKQQIMMTIGVHVQVLPLLSKVLQFPGAANDNPLYSLINDVSTRSLVVQAVWQRNWRRIEYHKPSWFQTQKMRILFSVHMVLLFQNDRHSEK